MSTEKNKKYEFVRRHHFSIWIILGLLGSLYLVIVLGLLTMRSQMMNFGWSIPEKVSTGQTAEEYLKEIVKKDSGENLTIVLTDNQINELMASSLQNIALSNAKAKIKPEGIVVSGTYPAIIPIKVDAVLIPSVKDGKVVFELGQIKSFGVPVPKSVSDLVTGSIAPTLNKMDIAEDKVIVEKIELTDGQAKITGKAR